jgi:NADH-quinone oxidoreductase subunit C
MSEVNNEYILQEVTAAFGADILQHDEPYGMLTLVVNPARINDLLAWFKNHPTIQANFLTDICGAHYPEIKGGELNVIYHIQSMTNNIRVRIKCFIPVENPVIASATNLYAGANWMERETYDYYGIQFEGHPNLKRILNVDEMDYFPLRKEYPLEDGTRTDKEDKYFGR